MELVVSLFAALWLGVLTSISPCPLATNIAAISFVSHRMADKTMVLLSGILYSIGRSVVYIGLSFVIVNALVNLPMLSNYLQRYVNKILGLLLILVGMVLLDLLRINVAGVSPSEKTQKKLDNAGIVGSFLLGALFALAFCPVSAALFFGSLIPLAIKAKSSLALPMLYGIGTALPVLAFAFLILAGAQYVSKFYQKITTVEAYAKTITGIIFIVVGIHLVLKYIFNVL